MSLASVELGYEGLRGQIGLLIEDRSSRYSQHRKQSDSLQLQLIVVFHLDDRIERIDGITAVPMQGS